MKVATDSSLLLHSLELGWAPNIHHACPSCQLPSPINSCRPTCGCTGVWVFQSCLLSRASLVELYCLTCKFKERKKERTSHSAVRLRSLCTSLFSSQLFYYNFPRCNFFFIQVGICRSQLCGCMSFVTLRRLSFISFKKLTFPILSVLSFLDFSYMDASSFYSISHSGEAVCHYAGIHDIHVRILLLKCFCHSNSPVSHSSVCLCHQQWQHPQTFMEFGHSHLCFKDIGQKIWRIFWATRLNI